MGYSLAQAAGRLDLKESTVRTYCKAILGKVGVGRQADLVRLILRSVAVLG
jgi:DNA-binding CsgD family transcriptional regulator